MNITETTPTPENKRTFKVEFDGNVYDATLWFDSDFNKIIDWIILNHVDGSENPAFNESILNAIEKIL